jgi:hypothetical protein
MAETEIQSQLSDMLPDPRLVSSGGIEKTAQNDDGFLVVNSGDLNDDAGKT